MRRLKQANKSSLESAVFFPSHARPYVTYAFSGLPIRLFSGETSLSTFVLDESFLSAFVPDESSLSAACSSGSVLDLAASMMQGFVL